MDLELNGKTVLITGAGSGMGQHMALGFAAEGAKVAINDINAGGVAETLALLRNAGGEACEACDATADITDLDAVNAMVDAVAAALGGIDILINNAALLAEHALFLETDPAACEREIRVILHGTMHCSRAVLPGMIERGGGKIIAITSAAPLRGIPHAAAYCAARGAQNAFIRATGLELAKFNIQVNAIAQNYIRNDTYYPDDMLESPKFQQHLQQMVPTKRVAEARETAQLALYLASPHCTHMVGQVLPLAGGWATTTG